MSAVVVSLRELFVHTKDKNWTNQERAHLARILGALERAGFCADLETGVSDEGDPWAVYCREDTDDVIVHIARIDDVYIFDSSVLSLLLRGQSFDSIIEQFMQTRSIILPPVSSQISVHPSAMLSAIVLTAFLVTDEIKSTQAFSSIRKEADLPELEGTLPHKDATFLHHLAELFSQKINADKSQDVSSYAHIGLLAFAFAFVTEYLSDGTDIFSELKDKVIALAQIQSEAQYIDTASVDFLADSTNNNAIALENEPFYQDAIASEHSAYTPDNTQALSFSLDHTALDIIPTLASLPVIPKNSESFLSFSNGLDLSHALVDIDTVDNFFAAEWMPTPPEEEIDSSDVDIATLLSKQFSEKPSLDTGGIKEFLQSISFDLHDKFNDDGLKAKDPLVSLGGLQAVSVKEILINAFFQSADNVFVYTFGDDLILYDHDVIADAQTPMPTLDLFVRETFIDDQNIVLIGLSDQVNAAFDLAVI